jgi:hypothetical protein
MKSTLRPAVVRCRTNGRSDTALDKILAEEPGYPFAFMLKLISNHYKT